MIVFPKNLIYSQFFLSECYFQMHPVIRSNICFPFNSTRRLGMGLSVHSPCESIVILISFLSLCLVQNRQTDQWNRICSRKADFSTYKNLISYISHTSGNIMSYLTVQKHWLPSETKKTKIIK